MPAAENMDLEEPDRDAGLRRVRESGLLESFEEIFQGSEDTETFRAVCIAKRRHQPTPILRTFSVANARKAGLWEPREPGTRDPRRMLQLQARARVLGDGFADVLGEPRLLGPAG